MSKRPTIEPTITKDDSPVGGDRYTHPAYGLIQVNRVHGGSEALFGSDFRHRNFMRISISAAELHRHLNTDWFHERSPDFIVIEMSEAQWATFITSPNSGPGVPCTIRQNASTPEYIVPEFPLMDSGKNFVPELDESIDSAKTILKKLREKISGNIKGMTKAQQDQILGALDIAMRDAGSSLDYISKTFGEHVETRVETAKTEIHAYMQGAISRLGLQALFKGEVPLQLEDSPEENPE